MHSFQVKNQKPYFIQGIETIHTPRLVVFKDRVIRNIKAMKSILEKIAPNTGFHHLCSHVKTNKSSKIIQMMKEAGISSFKCTPNEINLLINCGCRDIFIAYPLLEKDAVFVAEKIKENPNIQFSVQIGNEDHVHILREAAKGEKIIWACFIDVDVGMHRTGVAPSETFKLFETIFQKQEFHFMGLHGYDGHIHQRDLTERQKAAQEAMDVLTNVCITFWENGIEIPRIVTAGSSSFSLDLEIMHDRAGDQSHFQVSPGTWIFGDSECNKRLPNTFEIAAAILAQVMDTGPENRITLNLGHKRWGADRGPVELLSDPDLRVVSFSEEHTVLKSNKKNPCQIGDYILVVPRHVCSTVNLYETFVLIDEDGKIENLHCPVDARNR